MKPRTYLQKFRLAGLVDCLLTWRHASPISALTRRLIAISLAMLLLPWTESGLLAQQAQAPQEDPYYGQTSPDQDPGYAQQQPGYGYGQAQQPPYDQAPGAQPGYAPQQPLSAPQLEQMVAPIALYPDNLVALILTAATYPAQVAQADGWRQSMGNAPADQIAQGANAQGWDPSVKALTAFPQVLAQMDRNLQWTTDLGNAYYNQPQDVLEAVQLLRQRAQAAGTLQSTPQETVGYDQGSIVLAAPNPEVVYVPAYNPWTVYGAPLAPYPGFSLFGGIGSFFASTPLQYGLGILLSAFTRTGWGCFGWGLSWLNLSVLFNHSGYFSHSTSVVDWGLPHGGRRYFAEQHAMGRLPDSFDRGFGRNTHPVGSNWGRGTQIASAPRQNFMAPPNRSSEPRPIQNYPVRPNQNNFGRLPLQAYNRAEPMPANRGYDRQGYGSTFSNRPASGYSAQPIQRYSIPAQNYRTPYANQSLAYRSQPDPFRGSTVNTFHGGNNLFNSAPKAQHFVTPSFPGGGHSSAGFFAGGKPPKMPSSKGFGGGGGGHFGGGGGHSSSHGGGKHH